MVTRGYDVPSQTVFGYIGVDTVDGCENLHQLLVTTRVTIKQYKSRDYNGINHLRTGAGFLRSTVGLLEIVGTIHEAVWGRVFSLIISGLTGNCIRGSWNAKNLNLILFSFRKI